MPQSIPQGLKQEHVLQALVDLDAGIDHPFGAPTGYELVHEDKRYAPKAVVGLAFRYVMGRILRPDEFSGGEAPGQANYVLRQLGFTVVKKDKTTEEEEGQAGKDLSDAEVELIVADYFAMLHKELLGQSPAGGLHGNALATGLKRRSADAIDGKRRDISCVLVNLGLPYLEVYKPARIFRALLAVEVEKFLGRHPHLLEQLAIAPLVSPDKPPQTDKLRLEQVRVEPPEQLLIAREPSKPWLSRMGGRIDFAERDAANRRLGRLGEEFVVWFERQRLLGLGRDDLAQQVELVAETIGDGLGFDVLSFDVDATEKLIEVKTTGLGLYFPFYVTAVEVRCSEDVKEKFHLFRVFDFGRSPKLYILTGSLRERCSLEATLYRATR